MSRSSRQREKHGRRSEFSLENRDEGTAARTRPLSFDEIMLRRRDKEPLGDVKEGSGGAENTSRKHIIEKASDCMDSERHHDSVKASSRKKEDITYIRGENIVKTKDKENRDFKTKLKSIVNKDIGGNAKSEKIDSRVHDRRKSDQYTSNGSENETRRHSRDPDKYMDRGRGNSEKEGKRRHQKEDDVEKESKRKHRNEYGERSRDKNIAKKHASESYERKERKEASKSRQEESRSKRRRSRSREREKDRGRRSTSLSPRLHKRTSYNDSSKDKTGRQHSDVDTNNIPGNGSSSQYRRHDVPTSGLGGYSPRKRKTEAAVRTPSPTTRSPEKKSARWDLTSAKSDSNATSSVISNLPSSNQTALSDTHRLPNPVPVASIEKPPLRVFPNVYTNMNASVDFVQLTEATRPMRQLYVENLPASASEKSIVEFLNNFLLSSGVKYIDGTQRCISCIINKEKHQALVEFLTPADASKALSFDGRSFYDSVLKIRRPKDFVEVATGVPQKSVAVVDTVSDIVKDSPHKIFIGGISKVISSEMLMKVVSAFGSVKAYRYEISSDLNVPIAFLEYEDQSVTVKACGGLNGMSLGGQVLTVVQAIPDASSVEYNGDSPFYGIPEHAKPLLEKPTRVLKLKNVLDPEGLSSLSELELEEILEDIRFECARFGTVKSINTVKHSDCCTSPKTFEVANTGFGSNEQELESDDKNKDTEINLEKTSKSEHSSSVLVYEEVDKAAEDKSFGDEMCELSQVNNNVNANAISQELSDQLNPFTDQLGPRDDKVGDAIKTEDLEMEEKSMVKEESEIEEVNGNLESSFAGLQCGERMESNTLERGENEERVSDFVDAFEPGCVLVEYRRTEASCMAAHCLHGRLFDNRIVTVSYVDYNTYKARFPK